MYLLKYLTVRKVIMDGNGCVKIWVNMVLIDLDAKDNSQYSAEDGAHAIRCVSFFENFWSFCSCENILNSVSLKLLSIQYE